MDLSDDESPLKNCADIQENNLVIHNNHRPDMFGNNRICGNKEQTILQPPPPIPQNLCEIQDMSEDLSFEENLMTGKNQNGPLMEHMENHLMNNMPLSMPENMLGPGSMPFLPPPPQIGDMPEGMGWSEEWFDGRPPHSDMHNRPFPPPMFPKRHPNEFRGGFRGRGDEHGGEMFRGRGRGRGFRGMRGMNNWRPNRGFKTRGNRGFRGHFRGGF